MNESDFRGRYSVGETLSENLKSFFNEDEIELIPFGVEKIYKDNESLKKFIATPNSNFSHSAMMIKFAPDFILLKKTEPQELYFVETKDSVTPLCYEGVIKKIREKHKRMIPISDIGIIAREAWNAYKNLFPNLIIVSAATYNKSLLKAQFVNKIVCLRCYDGSNKDNCSCCPVNNGEFFPYAKNLNAQGSKTPHTNIDLASFMEFKDFFDKLGIGVNDENIKKYKEYLKSFGIKYSANMNEEQKEKIKKALIQNGCEWLK